MKELEIFGVVLAIVAYCLIVTGSLQIGFCIGFIASFFLALYFITISSAASVFLQVFFMSANLYGVVSL